MPPHLRSRRVLKVNPNNFSLLEIDYLYEVLNDEKRLNVLFYGISQNNDGLSNFNK